MEVARVTMQINLVKEAVLIEKRVCEKYATWLHE